MVAFVSIKKKKTLNSSVYYFIAKYTLLDTVKDKL